MKVLGTTTGGFIVEMDKEELARIQGYSSEYDRDFRPPVVGWEYRASKAWHLLRQIRERRTMLAKMAKELRLYADLIEYKEPEINKEVGDEPV